MQLNTLKLLRFFFVLMLGSTLLFTTGCDEDDDDEPDNEQELVTTVTLTFVPTGGGAPVVAIARDLDGDGGNAPTIQPIALKTNTSYALAVTFLDESKSPVVNITEEVEEESNEHLVCYAVTGSIPAPVIQDEDENGADLGLLSTLTTTTAGTGTLRISLKHEPNKGGANACSTGETDVEQTFNVTISN